MAHVLVINGPNLNLLGTREPETYGYESLDDIEQRLNKLSREHTLEFFQSNAESELIEYIHQAKENNVDFILLNPAAFTHTSIALRDALLGVDIPFIEIHLSNVHARERFRQQSYFSDIAVGVVTGLGVQSYELALAAALERIN